MYDERKAELKKEKKTGRILKKSAWAAGLGIGLILLKFLIVPLIGANEQAEKALVIFGWCLIAYGALMVLTFVFLRNFIFKINFVLSWIVLPLLFFKLLMKAI